MRLSLFSQLQQRLQHALLHATVGLVLKPLEHMSPFREDLLVGIHSNGAALCTPYHVRVSAHGDTHVGKGQRRRTNCEKGKFEFYGFEEYTLF